MRRIETADSSESQILCNVNAESENTDFLVKCAENEIRKSEIDMLYLASCALEGVVPDMGVIEDLDANLFSVCQKYGLTVCVAYALESADAYDGNFIKEKETAGNDLFQDENEKKRLEQYFYNLRKRLNL
ncbi:MAG: hypothetical protein J5864_02470 [Oscillospiraceae bacterium]|nr:hypothetical protein [Oscillospiraceae bacterium]